MTTEIVCWGCGEHIYNRAAPLRSGDILASEDFTPARPDIRQPMFYDEIVCPLCGAYFLEVGKLIQRERV